MSFEGYYRLLCKNGHLHCSDVYAALPFTMCSGDLDQPFDWRCSTCDEGMAWWEIVDQTNGWYEGCETKLRVKNVAVMCTCSECGNTHIKTPTEYEIPTTGGYIAKK